MKNISHEEKLEFYEKYHDKEFLAKFKNIGKNLNYVGFSGLAIFSVIALIGGVLNPWLFLSFIPALGTFGVCAAISNLKMSKAIKELSNKITLTDYVEMIETGEWKLLGYELNAKKMKSNHYAENSKLIVEEPKTAASPRKATYSSTKNVYICEEIVNKDENNTTTVI